MRLRITHKTSYTYQHPVAYALQQLRLSPKSRGAQRVLDWQIEVTGGNRELRFEDQHMNTVDLISFDPNVTHIEVHCEGEIELADTHGVTGTHAGYIPLWLFGRSTPLTKPGPLTRRLVRDLHRDEDRVTTLHALSAAIHDAIRYEVGRTDATCTAEEALDHGHGVCQDHAHVFVTCARLMGIPARYVSGYLMMNDRVTQDATHAWAEAHVDGLGWVGFDVSNGICPDTRYVRVATGLDYTEAAPISGTRFGPGEEDLSVEVHVQQQ